MNISRPTGCSFPRLLFFALPVAFSLPNFIGGDSPQSSARLLERPLQRWAGMATIKAIEAKSVHQIQSGQVIVDLCSVVKELVENSLDAGATAIEVRFKNNGLDSIEVQDNGAGIAPENYGNVALKHFTSKLSSYDDLSSLHTFGFRGEALSSLCALSKFSIITAQLNEVPKGNRLDFDILGRLKSANVAAAQKGTTAAVEDLFESLPVRRKELTKNIKREYWKGSWTASSVCMHRSQRQIDSKECHAKRQKHDSLLHHGQCYYPGKYCKCVWRKDSGCLGSVGP